MDESFSSTTQEEACQITNSVETNSTQRVKLSDKVQNDDRLTMPLGPSTQENNQQIININKRVNSIPIEGLRRGKRLKSSPLKLIKDFTSIHLL